MGSIGPQRGSMASRNAISISADRGRMIGATRWSLQTLTVGLCALVAAVAAGLVAWLAPSVIQDTERRLSDAVYRWGADRSPERRLVLIDIDERSLAELGAWPWPRSTQAKLIQHLKAAGAEHQVWDIAFVGEGGGTPAQQAAGQAELRQAMVDGAITSGQIFAIPGNANGPIALASGAPTRPADVAEGSPAGALPWGQCGHPFESATGFLAPPASLVGGMNVSVGHLTPRLEGDGVLRHQPAVVCYGGKAYPSLTIAALAQAAGPGWAIATDQRWGALHTLTHPTGLEVPLNGRGDVAIAWRQHPVGYLSLSASDVLNGRIPSGMLEGAWVLVGGSAFGLNDRVATPFGHQVPGMVAHAQLLLNILDGRTPLEPRWAPLAQSALVLVLWAGLALVGQSLRRQGPVLAPVAALAALPALWFFHAALLWFGHRWIGWVIPAIAVAVFGLTQGLLAHARSRVDRDRLFRHLASYLPPAVAQALVARDPTNRIEARQEVVTVLFADIRNFSAFCEARPPEEAAAVLHAFLMRAQAIVQEHGGAVEALQGDTLLAYWNAAEMNGPLAAGDGADLALRAARQLVSASAEFLPQDPGSGLEPLALGIGIETGPAMTGSIGPAERRTHALLGRTVTIASRLVAMSSELAHPILVGEGLAAHLSGQQGGRRLQSMGVFLLDGLKVPHHIYAWRFVPGEALGAEGAVAPNPTVTALPSSPATIHTTGPLH